MRNVAAPIALVVAAALCAAPAVAAKKKKASAEGGCKKEERFIEDGTPVLSGPGLGFPITDVITKGRCARVLRQTDDASFALILVEADKIGWIATGLVDASLSERDDLVVPEPLVPGALKDVKSTDDAVLRVEPRFDAPAVAAVKAGAALVVVGTSPDGQWLFTSAGADKGWVPKYQTVAVMAVAGAAPTAGTGAWAPLKPELAPGAPPVEPPLDPQAAKKAAADAAKLAALEVVAVPAAPEPPLLGRRQSITGALRASFWQEQYASDAQDDLYARYAVASFGGGASLAYSFRGDLPLVVDTSLRIDQLGFEFTLPDATKAYVPATSIALAALGGWRLFGSTDVDVDAAVGYGLDVFFLGDLTAAGVVLPVFATGVHHALRPKLSAKARLNQGRWGMVVVEGALPVGAYHLLPDPSDRYLTQPDPKDITQNEPRPGVEFGEPITDPTQQTTTYAHFGLGADGRIAYVAAITESLLLDVGLSAGARQAMIAGPGKRTASYAQATTVDAWAALEVGFGWAF